MLILVAYMILSPLVTIFSMQGFERNGSTDLLLVVAFATVCYA